MKIGFDAKRAFCNRTGLGNYSRTLIKGLASQFSEDSLSLYTPFVVSDLTQWFNYLKEKNTSIEMLTPTGWLFNQFPALWRAFKLSSLLGNQDIFHGLSHELPRGIEKSGVKSIVTIHDLIYLRYPDFFSKIDQTIYNYKFRHSCEVADLIVAISEQTKKDIIEFFDVDEKRIRVVYQSCNPIYYDDKKVEYKMDLPEKFLLFVGSFNERKNILTSIDAFSKNVSKFPELKFILVGSGHQEAKVKEKIRDLNLEDKVIHLKDIDSMKLKELYLRAEIFIFPSFFEGFGIPIIESLFCKTPVISSIGSCFSEAGGEGSLYVDPYSSSELADSIDKLLSDEVLYDELILKGYEHVQQFRFDNCARKMHEVYEEVLKL